MHHNHTWEGVDRVESEADTLCWEFQRRDAHLWEVGLEISRNLRGGKPEEVKLDKTG